MAQRAQLHSTLTQIPGVVEAYFQPPSNVQMKYPCIVYQRDSAVTEFADDLAYRHVVRYQITVIDSNPDSDIPDHVAELPMCTYSRFFVADNLNHDVFELYF